MINLPEYLDKQRIEKEFQINLFKEILIELKKINSKLEIKTITTTTTTKAKQKK